MIRKIAVCLTMFALGSVFTGCNDKGVVSGPAGPDDNKVAGGDGLFKAVDVDARPLLAPSGAEPALTAAATGANDFAFRLGAELAKNAHGQNFVFSPYSVWMPLAALVNAADATRKSDLLAALGASGVSEEDINRAASRMLYGLTRSWQQQYPYQEYYNPLKIANAIFADNKVTLRQDFAQIFMDYYRGSSINVDFRSREAADAVNNWASENTEGLITKVIDKFEENTLAAIANAIYFSDKWESEFNPDKTKEGDFHAPTGDSRAFYMLREGLYFNYYEDNRAQAVSLKFTQGGGMWVILPKTGAGGAEDLYSSMTTGNFSEIRKNSVLAEGKLLLPRFSIDNDVKGLMEGLKALGVPLFDAKEGPITNLIEEKIRLAVTSVAQKAVIKVDEKGTTAAAVTVIGMYGTSVPQPQKMFEMICDRPFMFVLYDHTYDGGDQILFTGIVNKP
jgi:serine protease inhibitor